MSRGTLTESSDEWEATLALAITTGGEEEDEGINTTPPIQPD